MATNPYRTNEQIKKAYDDMYAGKKKEWTNQANNQIGGVNTQFDTNQRSNYVNYMMGQKDLADQLGQMGIRGGGSETSMLRARTNYENNYNAAENARAAQIKSINDSLNSQLSNYQSELDEAMRQEQQAEREKIAAWEQDQQDRTEDRYAKTISGWSTIDGINKEIQRIKASGKGLWRIQYLRARRNELMEQGAGATGSGGGSYSYGGGGGGPTTTVKTTTTPKKSTAKTTPSKQGDLGYAMFTGKKNTGKQTARTTPRRIGYFDRNRGIWTR